MQRACYNAGKVLSPKSRLCAGRSHLQTLDSTCEPPLGAHLLTPRRGYTHHAIYVGLGRVVHYRGFSRGLRRGPVEDVSLAEFARGNPIWFRPEETSGADPEEVVRRAHLRVGEDRYRVFTNNCEHFCEWCIHGKSRSYQVDALIASMDGCRRIWRAFGVLVVHGHLFRPFRARTYRFRTAGAP